MFGNEPTAWIAFARAIIYASSIFGFNLDDRQSLALIAVVETGLALWNRKQVISVYTAKNRIAENRDVITGAPEC